MPSPMEMDDYSPKEQTFPSEPFTTQYPRVPPPPPVIQAERRRLAPLPMEIVDPNPQQMQAEQDARGQPYGQGV